MWVVHQTDDPFVYFGAKPNKGLGLKIFHETRSWGGKGRSERSQREEMVKEPRGGQFTKRDAERNREQTAEGSSPESTTVSRRKQWGKTSQDELAFLVALSKFREKYTPSDSLQNAQKAVQKMSQNYPSCSWNWPKSILFVCSFSPTPSVVFLVAVKKCEIPLSEPTRWITGHE